MHAEAVLEGLKTANESLNSNVVEMAKKAVAKGISLVSKKVKAIKIAERVTTVGLLCRNIYLMSGVRYRDERGLLRSLALFYSLAFCLVLKVGLCFSSEYIFPSAYFIAWNDGFFLGGGGGIRDNTPSTFLALSAAITFS